MVDVPQASCDNRPESVKYGRNAMRSLYESPDREAFHQYAIEELAKGVDQPIVVLRSSMRKNSPG
jgi:hypothetical protein